MVEAQFILDRKEKKAYKTQGHHAFVKLSHIHVVDALYSKTAFKAHWELSKTFDPESAWGLPTLPGQSTFMIVISCFLSQVPGLLH